ncbi:MAG: YqaJ viral recombinase family protein [Rhodocyclaceae bacterium]|nr:YqaJ viral recombinase family protein [Rhodocyclaceae bacterium]
MKTDLVIARRRPILLDETGAGRDRTKSLGGSDVAAILGVSKWCSPLQLWEKKTGRSVEEITAEKRKLFERGKRWEQPAFEMLCDELRDRGHEVEVIGNSRRYRDGEFDFLTCEIDREIALDGEVVNVEIKTVHPFAAGEWGDLDEFGGLTDEVPIYYQTQVMHGLGITGADLCVVGALFGADRCVPYLIERDDETIDAIRARCVEFWQKNILKDIAPDPINMQDIASLMYRVNGKPVEINQQTFDRLTDLVAVRAKKSSLEKREEELKFAIFDGIWRAWGVVPPDVPEDDARLFFNGVEVGTFKQQSKAGIDTTKLKKDFPQAAAACDKPSHFRVIKVKK